MRWVDALKEWNKGSPTWCIARKGTKAYDEVKAIMAGKKIEASAEPKAEAKPMAQGIDMREVQRKRKQKAKLEELKQSAKDTVASAMASIPAPAPRKNMMPSMMASIADIANKAKAAKEKAWTAKTRDGKVYKRTIGGVVYLSDYLNQLWTRDPDGSVGDWVGVYLPSENRIDTTASDPFEVVALPVMKEKQNTSKTELEEELDVGFVYKPAGRRMEQSIFEDIVRMAGEMERADPKFIIRKEMEKVPFEKTQMGKEAAIIWNKAMEGLLKNASFSYKVEGTIGSEDIEKLLDPVKRLPTARQLEYFALIRMLERYNYMGPEFSLGDYYRLSAMSISFSQETMDDIASEIGLYDHLNMMPGSFYDALSKIYKPDLEHTPRATAQELEDWLNAEENEEFEDYYGTFLAREGISTTLKFSQRYEESKERDKLLEEFETIMKQKGAQVGKDWRKHTNESLQEGIDKMKKFKDKEVSNDDEGERKKLVKEVKELLTQKGRKLAGYTTLSIKNLKERIEALKARPDKK